VLVQTQLFYELINVVFIHSLGVLLIILHYTPDTFYFILS